MKTFMSMALAALCLGLGGFAPARAGSEGMHEHYMGSKEFENLKKLEGKWEGAAPMGKEKAGDKVTVEYGVTSGGSVLTEKLFPGTPHEMLSVYHDKDGKLAMTHYCMMHNQPLMELKSSSDKKLEFSLAKVSGIKANEAHMHALTIEFQDDDHMTQTWTSYQDGKEKETSVFKFSRVR